MSKFKEYILEIEDQTYRDLPGFSYSLLKNISEEGPQALVYKKNLSGDALNFGSLVDLILTNNGDTSSKFHTKQIGKPTASLLELADALLMDLIIMDEGFSYLTHENIQAKIKAMGLWSKMVDQDKLKAKYDEPIFWTYMKESFEAKGKIIVSQETLEAAEHCANVL
jgi:hypothetical protein